MKFIKFTQALGSKKDTPIYINSSYITFIKPDKSGTAIAFTGGGDSNFIVVQEDINTVFDNVIGKKNDFVFSVL